MIHAVLVPPGLFSFMINMMTPCAVYPPKFIIQLSKYGEFWLKNYGKGHKSRNVTPQTSACCNNG